MLKRFNCLFRDTKLNLASFRKISPYPLDFISTAKMSQGVAENYAETVIIVNEQNEILGYENRKTMRDKKLGHRASYIFIVNSEGRICTHLRHQDKAWCGGYWTTVFGGCVGKGEDYASNAVKEIAEEAGIQNKLNELECFNYWTPEQRVWGKIFWQLFDGEINFQKEEIQKISWKTLTEIKQLKDSFTPDGNKALEVFLGYAQKNRNDSLFFDKMLNS